MTMRVLSLSHNVHDFRFLTGLALKNLEGTFTLVPAITKCAVELPLNGNTIKSWVEN